MRKAFDIIKTHYDASDRHDMDGMLADIAPDCRWTEMEGFPCAGTYVGPQEIFKNVFQALELIFDDFTFTLERLLDAGDDAVAIGYYSATSKQTGKAFKSRVVHVWGVRENKIRRFEQFTDTLKVAQSMQ